MRAVGVLLKFIMLTLALGSVGYFVWLSLDWLAVGRLFWPANGFRDWCAWIIAVAIFFGAVCVPLQLIVRWLGFPWASVPVGAVAGPVFVWLALLVLQVPLSLSNYVLAPVAVSFWAIFASIGLLFSLGFRRMLGPNKSFKPKPLRGSA